MDTRCWSRQFKALAVTIWAELMPKQWCKMCEISWTDSKTFWKTSANDERRLVLVSLVLPDVCIVGSHDRDQVRMN